jgi:hypothetical protein
MPTRSFRELLEAMPTERQRRIEEQFQKSLAAMPLDQLRKAQEMAQLPGDTLIKSLAEARMASDRAAEATLRGAGAMAEALRTGVENSATKQLLEHIKMHEELTRSALGPIWELQRAGLLDPASPWGRGMEPARQAAESFQARFVLPGMADAARLMAEFSAGHFSEVAKYAEGAASGALKAAMESMRTPWLDAEKATRSIASFAEIQGIGQALRTTPAFDETLAATLRTALGDWRDPITWRPEVFTDLGARSDFYVSLGFNTALTDFPPPAFAQSLDIAGLLRESPTARGDGDQEERGLERTNAAHDRLQRLERQLRRFIDEQMTLTCGADWPKRRVPNAIYEDWLKKKGKAKEEGAEERPLIDYADFTDYTPVICRADNWREVFAAFFKRADSVRESFQRLYPIRLDTMHARIITQDDELLLCVEAKRLVKAIANRRN